MTALPDPQRLDSCRRILLRRGGHALVVDDEKDLTALIETLLESCGFLVTTAHNAWDAQHLLELGARGDDAPRRPDLVILDYELGDATGFEVLARLRKFDHGRAVKVLMLTGTQKSIPESMPLDADAFVRKPFEAVFFLETVIRLLGLEDAEA